jgi:hypothetical protein
MTAIEEAVRSALGKLTIAFEHELPDLESTVAVFTEALRDLAPLDIDGATTRVIRTERYFPRPAILRGHALEEQLARTVWVAPYIAGDDRICPLCGADGYWLRGFQQPDRDESKVPKKVLDAGEHKGRFVERIEVLHDYACRLRHPAQGYGITTNAA